MKKSDLVSNRWAALKRGLFSALSAALLIGSHGQAEAATLPSGFAENQIATGLSGPTRMEFAPDGRLFVLEEGGRVRVIKNGSLLSTPFITLNTDTQGERGVLGIAFDPQFSSNGYVYIYYTATSPSTHNRVSRFTANTSNPDTASTSSEVTLLDLPNLGAIYHNGGALAFGIDGKLYIAVGDNKTNSPAQSTGSLLGKILRINKDGTIPTDNPFYSSASGNNRAIWALGFRNPFSFAIQPGTGTTFVNDVGENTWEEIDVLVKGGNYGWPNNEGHISDPKYVDPIYAGAHSGGVCSIIGAAWYNPTTVQFPQSYVGKYFFGDYCAGWIHYIDPSNNKVSNFASGISSLVDIKVATDGSLYYLERGDGGSVFRVHSTQAGQINISVQPADQTVNAGQPVTFSVTATGGTLTYQWQKATAAAPTTFSNISGATAASYTFTTAAGDNSTHYRVVISNGSSTATSSAATLTVTAADANPPVPVIDTPVAGTTYGGGQVISFSGHATDVEDGNEPASRFSWQVVFHHHVGLPTEHTHPFIDPPAFDGQTGGSFTIPNRNEVDADVLYRIHLFVTDAGGRTTEVTRDIVPRTSTNTLTTNPGGLGLTLDGIPVTAPYTFTGVEGILRTLGAPSPQTLGSQAYAYQSWSDAGAQTHDIATPASNTTYTAFYQASVSGTPISFEAESLSYTTSGPGVQVQNDANTSGGVWISLLGTKAGDYIDYPLPSIPAGTYSVALAYKTNNNRAIHTLAVDGQVLGTLDQYAALPSTYPTRDFGTITFSTAGTHTIRLAVTGKNSASSTYTVSADKFVLTPIGQSPVSAPVFNPGAGTYTSAQSVTITSATPGASIRYTTDGSPPSSTTGTLYSGPVTVSTTTTLNAIAYKSGSPDSAITTAAYTISSTPPTTVAFEAESASPVGTGATVSSSTDANASGGTVEFLNADSVGDYVEFKSPQMSAGTYHLTLKYKQHPNRGQLNLKVDGTQLGGVLDEYSANPGYVSKDFGTITFASAGVHTIRLTVTGKNASAGAYTLSADAFIFTP